MEFEWDPEKEQGNRDKHDIDFWDLEPVFYDDQALETDDPEVEDEQRYVRVGQMGDGRIVTVIYTWRDERIRIISARHARRKERRQYLAGDEE